MSAIEAKSVVEIPVIRIVNPFDPRDFVRETLVWERTKPLADYFPHGTAEFAVSINGQPVEQDAFAVTYLDKTDNLIICPVLQGGEGGGKSIFRLVAMIAIMYFTAGAGNAWLVGSGSLTGATGMAATMIGAGAAMVGGMLLNALMPPPKRTNDSLGGNGADIASSPTYGVDGAKNSSAEGLCVPVCYGGYRMGGNILDMYVENSGNTQNLYMLINAGEGPVASLTDIQINDQPISNFRNVEIQTRDGSPNQEMIPWFADTIIPHSVGKVLPPWEYVSYLTENVVDRIRIDLIAPQGIGVTDQQTGARSAYTIPMSAQVRKVGTDNWIECGGQYVASTYPRYHYKTYSPLVPVYYGGTGQFTHFEPQPPPVEVVSLELPYTVGSVIGGTNTIQGLVQVVRWSQGGADDGPPQPYITEEYQPIGYVEHVPVYADGFVVSGNQTTPLRQSVYSPVLEQGMYEVRILRKAGNSADIAVQDEVSVTDINEIILDDVAYVNTALVALRIQLDEQLNGIPKVTYMNGGRLLNQFNFATNQWITGPTKNPAWIVLDALTHTRYGGSMSYARFDIEMFKEWARHCDQYNLTFEGVIDTTLNLWDAMQPVMRCGHAQIVNVGTRYTVVIERATSATMMFGVGNIIEGTFKQTWLAMAERANEIEVTFYDKTDDYKSKTVRVVDAAAMARGDAARPAAITMVGITDMEKAYKEGFFQLNLNRYILQTIEFSAPMEAIACTVGDMIYVQHDMPQWGFAGRTEQGSTASTINLDRPVEIVANKQYKLLMHLDAIKRAQGSIVSVIGDSIILSGWNGTGRVKRIKTGGLDRAVLSTFNAGGGLFGVVVEQGAYGVGNAYELWDTDVIEERDVIASPGEHTQLTAMSPFSVAPDPFVNWMFGEVNKVKKPFRVRMISGSHEYRRDISCIEYNDSCYDFSGMVIPTPNFSSLPANAEHAIIDGVSETVLVSAAGFSTELAVGFHGASQSYSSSTVKASINGGAFATIATGARDSASVIVKDGDVVIFKVIATDTLAASPPESTAPTITHTVQGTNKPLSKVEGFTITERTNDLEAKWLPNPEAYLKGYEVRQGPSWDSGTVVISNFAGTTLLLDQDLAGTYLYHIRAVGVTGVYSEEVSTFEITLRAPIAVAQFDCVQSGTRLEFRWLNNPETNIVGYEVREGEEWNASNFVYMGRTTSLTIPAGSAGSRTFWIKAIAAPGVYGETAVFVRTDIAQPSNTNLIFSDDQAVSGFSEVKHDMELIEGKLVMAPDVARSEYIFKVELATNFRGRNTVFTSVDAVRPNLTTWEDASFSWNSLQANRQWVDAGDIASTTARYQIAAYKGLAAGQIDGWTFDNTTTSVDAVPATQAVGVSYAAGRYSQGLRVQDTTLVSFPVAIAPVFTKHFWIKAEQVTDAVYWTATGAGGISLRVRYSTAEQCFFLEDHLMRRNRIDYPLEVGDKVLLAVSQTATERRFFLGRMDGASILQSVKACGPVGALTAARLY